MGEPLTDDDLGRIRVFAQTGDLFTVEGRGGVLLLLDEHAALRRERVLLVKAVAASTAVYDVHGDRSPLWERLRAALDALLRFDAERERKGP